MPDVVGKRLAICSFRHVVLGLLTPSIIPIVTVVANLVATLQNYQCHLRLMAWPCNKIKVCNRKSVCVLIQTLDVHEMAVNLLVTL